MSATAIPTRDPISALGARREVALLRARIESWLACVDHEVRAPLSTAFAGEPKCFRPLTLFAAHRALHGERVTSGAIELAFAVELMHNMSLVVDDVLDKSDTRRGVATLLSGFGTLPALMSSGYLMADAFDAVAEDPFATRHLAELLRRLAAAECLQWRLRRMPLGTEDWRRIAGEDTGSMFEICAVLGGRSERLRRFGHLVGTLYHGCDDVADQRGVEALGGGGDEDVRDGILTLPAALAIRDSAVRQMFSADDEDGTRLSSLAAAFRAQLEPAEEVLDGIANEARAEATLSGENPDPLLALVDEVRLLSRR